MKAFLTALLATVVIAVAVHYSFRWLAPRWNSAVVLSQPSVRLSPEDLPTMQGGSESPLRLLGRR